MHKLHFIARKKQYCILLLAFLFLLATVPAYAAPTLRVNAKGNDVTILQQKLIALSYSIKDPRGKFAADTHYAVKNFQRDHKLKSNGVVDDSTWEAIEWALKTRKIDKLPSVVTPLPNLPDSNPVIEGSRNNANAIISTAKQYIGVPYKFGGTTPKGFDCSGYLQYVFAEHKINLPRTADDQYKIGKQVNKKSLQVGDLVFFTTYESGVSHCGLYIGNGQFIHTSSSKGVRIDKLNDPYWQPRYIGAKCILK